MKTNEYVHFEQSNMHFSALNEHQLQHAAQTVQIIQYIDEKTIDTCKSYPVTVALVRDRRMHFCILPTYEKKR